jgi:hypothetical protein
MPETNTPVKFHRRHPGQRRRIWLAAMAVAPASLLAQSIRADSTWTAASDGYYFDPSNWSNGVPAGSANSGTGTAYFGAANATYTVTVTNYASIGVLDIEGGANPTFQLSTLSYSGGTLNVGGMVGGTATTGSLSVVNGIFDFSSGAGTFNVASGSGSGSFTQLGPSTVRATTLLVGTGNGNGTYTLSGGYLYVFGNEAVAGAGSVFTQSTATNIVNNSLYVGSNTLGSGSYSLRASKNSR